MKTFRKWLWLLGALTLAVFALPASAAPTKDKLYMLNMCVGEFNAAGDCLESQNPGGVKTLQARVFNASPPKATNSQISSFDLFVTNGLPWKFSNPQVLPPDSGQVDVTSTPGHIKVTNLNPAKPQESVIVQFDVDADSCGEGVWDVTPYTGSGLTGNTFTRDSGNPPHTPVVCGEVDCGASLIVRASAGTPLSDPRYVLLTRSPYNQNGTSACTALGVVVTPVISPNVTVSTHWDPEELALFQYTVNLYSNSNTTPPVVQVAWKLKSDLTTPDFQKALDCEGKSPGLPTLYATLAADNGGKIQVNPPVATLPAVPFPITLESERMVVTKVNSQTNTWTVTRSPGSQTHASGNILSTPLPVIKSSDGYPQSYVGTVAKMCKNAGPTYTGAPANADGLYPWSTTIIDGADAVVKGSF